MNPRDLPPDAADAAIMGHKHRRAIQPARPALTLAASRGRAYAPWVDTLPMLPQLTQPTHAAQSTLPGDSGSPTTQPQPREVAPRIPRIAARRAAPLMPAITSAAAALMGRLLPYRAVRWLATRQARAEAERLEWLMRWRAAMPGKVRRQQARFHAACNRIDALQAAKARAVLAKTPMHPVVGGR